MIEKIRGISISGRCFHTKTSFDFFPEANNRISVVYGRNGSGKSTISEGFAVLSKPDSISDLTVELVDDNGETFVPTEPEKIFVFNERYIDENVKIDDDGLGTIILLGGQVDIQEEIEKYKQLSEQAELALETASAEYDKYLNPKSILSPAYHYEHIRAILKQNGGWAETDSRIKGNRRNSSVTDEIVDEICKLIPTENKAALQARLTQLWDILKKTSDATDNYPIPISTIELNPGFEDAVCNILAKKIREPVLTEREEQILAVIQNGRQDLVESARKTFGTENQAVCPYCLQPIAEDYKHNLLESINCVLNKDVDDHTNELHSIIFPSLSFDYRQFSALDAELVSSICIQQTKCTQIIEQYQQEINNKASNIYSPVIITKLGLENAIVCLNDLIRKLEIKRFEFNDAAKRRKNITQELITLNKQIAHWHIESEYKDYLKQVHAEKICKKNLETKKQSVADLEAHLKSLQQKKANTGLAINNINNALDYVFFSKGRLSIELRNDKYYLKSNGQDVRPKNISLGERNIIALCYFFTQIMANQDIAQLYKTEELVVIDDPISSFDFENRVGITSLLKYQMNRIVMGNYKSKILILSHDLTTVFDLQKAAKEVCDKTKGIASIPPLLYYPGELTIQSLKRFTKTRSEYYELLQTVYQYANGNIEEDTPTVGNAMRRVLEAFSTFTYRKNIEDVSCDPNILAALGEHATYYENLMYRLVLHGESHYEEQVYNLHDDVNFYQFVSESEKRRTAKDILCFMYLLNPHHIEAYMKQTANAIENIKNWAKHIPVNSSFEISTLPAIRVVHLYDIPLSAGMGNELLDDSYEDYETSNKDCDFALRISGDSMEPHIPNGSIVLIKSSETIPEGKIGAFYYNGQVFCKKLVRQDNGLALVSLNSSYAPIPITAENTLRTYGKVIEVIAP